MSNSILYYPTIEFRHEDYQWLWNAALFADKIYRIVPPGYELNEPRNIRELCSTGEIGIPLSPVPYGQQKTLCFTRTCSCRNDQIFPFVRFQHGCFLMLIKRPVQL